MIVPPLVVRAGQEGAAHGPLLHVLAGHVRDGRVGERGTDASAWLAAALAPGMALFVVAPPAALGTDPDVHAVGDLASEAPYELLALAGAEPEEALGLLAPRGLAFVASPREPAAWHGHAELAVAALPHGAILAVRAA